MFKQHILPMDLNIVSLKLKIIASLFVGVNCPWLMKTHPGSQVAMLAGKLWEDMVHDHHLGLVLIDFFLHKLEGEQNGCRNVLF